MIPRYQVSTGKASSKKIVEFEFKRRIKKMYSDIFYISGYEGSNKKVNCYCLMCNNFITPYAHSLLANKGCPICSRINTRITEEDFFKVVKINYPNVQLLTPYTKSSAKYKCKCLICNYTWEVQGSKLLCKKTGCRNCYKTRKMKTNSQYIKELNNINPDIITLSEYKGGNEPIDLLCKICGYKWTTRAQTLLRGSHCPKCIIQMNAIKATKTTEQFINELKQINSNITVIGEYTGANNKIKVQCVICSHKWTSNASSLLCGTGCPNCSGRFRNIEMLKHDVELISPEIEILGEYINAVTPIKCKCKKCNELWYPTPNTLMNGHSCPYCNFSHGEKIILQYLNKHNINYIPQITYNDLFGIGGKNLSYDFYLIQHNILIEFQGKQHEIPIDYFGGEEQFNIQQEHDKRKRQYAKDHNIKLLEIWYYEEEKIEQILDEYINSLSLTTAECA